MSYASWSVVFGEQPSAAKWNILGTNDSSFNDGTGIADDKIHSRHIDWASTGTISGDSGGIWWEELGRTTLSVADDTISVTSLPVRTHLLVILTGTDTGGSIGSNLRFNNDTGSNYAHRFSDGGAADTTQVSQTSMIFRGGAIAAPVQSIGYIYNIATDEKVLIYQSVTASTAGAGNAPGRTEGVGKWVNTTDSITRIDAINIGAGDFAIGSELVVLGHN